MMRLNNLLVGPVARLPWRVQTKLLVGVSRDRRCY